MKHRPNYILIVQESARKGQDLSQVTGIIWLALAHGIHASEILSGVEATRVGKTLVSAGIDFGQREISLAEEAH